MTVIGAAQAGHLEGQHAGAGGDQRAHARGLARRRRLMGGEDLLDGERAGRRHLDPGRESGFPARPSREAEDERAAEAARVDLRLAARER